MTALRVGLVGAGPWATMFHAPMIAAGPETTLTAVWARRPEAAQDLASKFDARAAESFEALLEASDALVFAVPPDVQAHYAPKAAKAGKALLLEKPLGLDLAQARAVADAVTDAGVVNQVMFTNRYNGKVRQFVADVSEMRPIGAVATYVNGACLPGGLFATPWRIDKGAVLDLAPHILELLDSAVGPIETVEATGDPRHWVAMLARHSNGVLSQIAVSLNTPVRGEVTGVRVFTEEGEIGVDLLGADTGDDTPANIRSEFAAAVKAGVPHSLDVRRALYIQQLLQHATDSLGR